MKVDCGNTYYAYSFNNVLFYGIFNIPTGIFKIAESINETKVYVGLFDSTNEFFVNPFTNLTLTTAIERCCIIAGNAAYNQCPCNNDYIISRIKNNITTSFDKWIRSYALTNYKEYAIKIKLYEFDDKAKKWITTITDNNSL